MFYSLPTLLRPSLLPIYDQWGTKNYHHYITYKMINCFINTMNHTRLSHDYGNKKVSHMVGIVVSRLKLCMPWYYPACVCITIIVRIIFMVKDYEEIELLCYYRPPTSYRVMSSYFIKTTDRLKPGSRPILCRNLVISR